VVIDLAVSELDRVHARVAGRFARSEPRARSREYVHGLVGLERKNGWVRHEAPSDRVGVRDRLRWVVAADLVKLGAA
jgi:hypothetical protein